MACKENIISVLSDLISFKTDIPENSLAAIKYIAQLLEKSGFICDIQIFGTEKIPNLYAIWGHKKPNICFAGHVDVVGASSDWCTNPFKLEIRNGKVYGRGVADMKAALACSISAALDMIKLYKISDKMSISFLITGDEEGKAENGTRKMLEHIKERYDMPDLSILGEPTSEHQIGDTVKIGRRGSINFQLKIRGIEAHVAYPEKAEYALEIALNISRELLIQNQYFSNSTYLTITNIYTNNKNNNVTPSKVILEFNIRFSNQFTPDSLNREISSIIKKHSQHFELTYHCNSLPFQQIANAKIQNFHKKIEEITGLKAHFSNKGGTSDARFISKYFPVIEFGLFSNQAHKTNENAKLVDINKLYEIYFQYLKTLL
ncbi:MAG: succinyl-diaminopimelate desuccinylase [Rickettsia sp.]|nr:succinyl-diaminopimelate desuccinylase [Rickettsia sp.]